MLFCKIIKTFRRALYTPSKGCSLDLIPVHNFYKAVSIHITCMIWCHVHHVLDLRLYSTVALHIHQGRHAEAVIKVHLLLFTVFFSEKHVCHVPICFGWCWKCWLCHHADGFHNVSDVDLALVDTAVLSVCYYFKMNTTLTCL